jgi:hypothetical protein
MNIYIHISHTHAHAHANANAHTRTKHTHTHAHTQRTHNAHTRARARCACTSVRRPTPTDLRVDELPDALDVVRVGVAACVPRRPAQRRRRCASLRYSTLSRARNILPPASSYVNFRPLCSALLCSAQRQSAPRSAPVVCAVPFTRGWCTLSVARGSAPGRAVRVCTHPTRVCISRKRVPALVRVRVLLLDLDRRDRVGEAQTLRKPSTGSAAQAAMLRGIGQCCAGVHTLLST